MLQIEADQSVDRLPSVDRVVFADADHPASTPIQDTVGVTKVNRGSQRPWLAPGILAIDPLVGEVAEIDNASVHDERPSTVLVDPCADVERRRRDVGHRTVRRTTHDHVASAFLRPHLDPVDVVALQLDLPESDRVGDYASSGDRRFPGAEGCDSGRWHFVYPCGQECCTRRQVFVLPSLYGRVNAREHVSSRMRRSPIWDAGNGLGAGHATGVPLPIWLSQHPLEHLPRGVARKL